MRHACVIGNTDGIGLALTRRLLDEGWAVTGLSRRPAAVEHDRYVHVAADVTAPGYAAELTRALDAAGGADLCVYAAGVGEFLDLDNLAAQTRIIEVNLLGATRTADVVVPRMLAAGSGHFVGLSSLADAMITPMAPGYAASKAGLSTYLISLGAAVRPRGVQVTAVRFGYVDTKLALGPVKPMMITVDRAVDVLMRCIRTRPAVVSYPRRMAALIRAVSPLARTQARLKRR
ncbi:SDR family NAD(P)-dependent oxidoreductase [Actinoplanes friuliensis]|uniref:Short-chain dehydrogenase/reductase SDR n=1 Tax=Actinoplanes friuliensis DSM 7358 TaxID=1246995 RepID=U5W6Q8_9ACTN|nr:SDR family NAD(P)-dependent oxidoreductase [Actinoplanes friuliensis]AGZ44893.1 short-chain dehydrogenase/reductase SDR [Actinoplanes friuliensis DSM 7358]